MGEFQTLITVIMALIIGFVMGRVSKKSADDGGQFLTQEEQARLRPQNHYGEPDGDPNSPYMTQEEAARLQSKQRYGDRLEDHDWDLQTAIQAGNKIQAIKLYRDQHGTSLKEAKDAIELLIKLNQ